MHFKLHIPEPCHEDWSQMTPREQGRFCASCKKEVIDFTALSRNEIASKVKSGTSICGRYRKDQLETTYFIPEKKPLKNLGIAAAFTSLLALCEPAMGQEANSSLEFYQINLAEKMVNESTPVDSIKFKGVVFSEVDEPLPGVNIFLKGTQTGVISDLQGSFEISIPINNLKLNPILVLSYIGFKNKEIKISRNSKKLKVTLETDDVILGDIIVVDYSEGKN